MDAGQPERQPRRRLRILLGVVLVLIFLGSTVFFLFKSPLPLPLAVVSVVVAAVSAAVFVGYILPIKLSPRLKRAVAVGVGAATLIPGLAAIPALQRPQGPAVTLDLRDSR